MLDVLLCCLGGFSSSALVGNMKKEMEKRGMSDRINIDFSPFAYSPRVLKEHEYDIIICCPHLARDAKKFIADNNIKCPVYVLPPQMYGVLDPEEIEKDCLDVMEIYETDKTNPVHFPGEANIYQVKRRVAYYNQPGKKK